ncbi:MAG: hypothetical protein U0325_09830 [Polyangiales bacterium]
MATRPLTVPRRTLLVGAGFGAAHIELCRSVFCVRTTATTLSLSGAYGVVDALEVGATVLPLQLTDTVRLLNPSIYGRYRLVRSDSVQVGAELFVLIPAMEGSSASLQLSVPVWLHASEVLRVQTGLSYAVIFDRREALHSFIIPANFVLNATDALHFGVNTGLTIAAQDAQLLLVAPLGFEAGVAVAGTGDRPLVDIVGAFLWPAFIASGGRTTINSGIWTASLSARFFFFL